MTTYVSQYPPEQSDTYVKATTYFDEHYYPHFATDPTKSLVWTSRDKSWASDWTLFTNQRFHIDLGSAKVIRRIYYENAHNAGGITDRGAKNFTFWGSNTEVDFLELTYAEDGTWTELTVSQNTFDKHIAADQADPKYITVTNSTAYRYYAFKFADNHSSDQWIEVRRIELQTEAVKKNIMQALLEGIWDKYVGSALESEINGMFFTFSPQGTAYPYGVYHLISGVPSWTFDADMENYIIQFNLYSEKNSSTEVNTAFTALTTLYDWCTLDIDGYSHIYMKRKISSLTRESGIWNYMIEYSLEVQK